MSHEQVLKEGSFQDITEAAAAVETSRARSSALGTEGNFPRVWPGALWWFTIGHFIWSIFEFFWIKFFILLFRAVCIKQDFCMGLNLTDGNERDVLYIIGLLKLGSRTAPYTPSSLSTFSALYCIFHISGHIRIVFPWTVQSTEWSPGNFRGCIELGSTY